MRDRFRSGKRGAELGKAWSRCKGRRGGPGCAESEDGGRSWSGRRRRGRLCSARAQGRRREWKHGSSGIRSGGFVGDKNVRGTRMAGAWHEDGRRWWRRAARRDSCNARRSRAPGGPSGQEIWGRDNRGPPPSQGVTAYSSGPTVDSPAGAGVGGVPLTGITTTGPPSASEVGRRASPSPTSSTAAAVLGAPQGLWPPPSVLGKRQGEVGSSTAEPKPRKPRPTAAR